MCVVKILLWEFQLMVSSSITSYTLREGSRERWCNWFNESLGCDDPLYYSNFVLC